MSYPLPLSAVGILAGGASRRMGRDKATLTFGGRTLLERAVDAALTPGVPVYVLGRSPTDVAPPALGRLDDVPGGPGEAVAAFVRDVGAALVLPVDMPLLDGATLVALRDAWAGGDHGVVATSSTGDRIPTLAVVTPADVRRTEPRSDGRGRSLRALTSRCRSVRVPIPDGALRNVNTPADWDALVRGTS